MTNQFSPFVPWANSQDPNAPRYNPQAPFNPPQQPWNTGQQMAFPFQQQGPPQTANDMANALLKIRGGNAYGTNGRTLDRSVETPEEHQARWDAQVKASSPVARAQKEAEYYGIPVEQTHTGQYLQDLYRTPQERMNRNLGFTDDMSMEQRRQILAESTARQTGKPVASYLPQMQPNVVQSANGGADVYSPDWKWIGRRLGPMDTPNVATMNGQPLPPSENSLPFNNSPEAYAKFRAAGAADQAGIVAAARNGDPQALAHLQSLSSGSASSPEAVKAHKQVVNKAHRTGRVPYSGGLPDNNPFNRFLGQIGL